ncbi:hypothetical protein [Almyronema epifaneia]|uniref:Uncharacterized protein n=1 Tax=Almyronema epifaneia S1 TaxID=2991925 RepID=A0ABW6IGS8_9CYAN
MSAPSSKPILQGRLYQLERQPYAQFIWPLVQVKRVFQLAYDLLLGLMWDELVKGRRYSNTLTSLLLLLIFAVLSLLFYYLRDFDHWLFIGFGLLWWFDVGFAKQQYFCGQTYQQVAVAEKADDELEVVVQRRQQTAEQAKFRRSQVDYILIKRQQVRGGAFKETLTYIWQGNIVLRDRTQYLVFEKQSALTALKAARKLAHYLHDIPVIFAHSQGQSRYAAEPLTTQTRLQPQQSANTIHQRQQQQQWHIFVRWNLGSAWRMLKEALQQSGFLLFVVLTTKFMAQTGELLHQIWLQANSPVVIFLPSLRGLSPEWLDWLEVAIAFGLVLGKGLEISQEEHFYINAKRLSFCLNRRQMAQLKTAEVDTLLYLRSPEPMLLIADQTQAIEVKGLQTEAEFQTLLAQLEQAIASVGKP